MRERLISSLPGVPLLIVADRGYASPAFRQHLCDGRKRIEMLFAHLDRILRLGRLRLRGPCGAQDEFLLAATAQNLRKLEKLVISAEPQVAPAA